MFENKNNFDGYTYDMDKYNIAHIKDEKSYNNKNLSNYYNNYNFIESTFYMLCKCLLLFNKNILFRTIFDILFLFFINKIRVEVLIHFFIDDIYQETK